MKNVFLSRPTAVTSRQATFCEALEARLREHGLEPNTVGVNQFGNEAPLLIVRKLMEKCAGAVVLGLSQFSVTGGMKKPGTPDERRVRRVQLATPWNQLEAGIAYGLGLPLLIIREEGVEAEGIFDPQVGDRFVHQTDLTTGWLDSARFTQPFGEWAREVHEGS